MAEKGFYVYSIPPMDFGWSFLPTVREYQKKCVDDYPFKPGQQIDAIEEFLTKSLDAAKARGWEGDFRTEPRVVILPDVNEAKIGLVWKQDNNGVTFVTSEVELPWLNANKW